ncbi:MAG: hypothetical protein AB4426_30720 [Xenococcaceae cyanobacterium]
MTSPNPRSPSNSWRSPSPNLIIDFADIDIALRARQQATGNRQQFTAHGLQPSTVY